MPLRLFDRPEREPSQFVGFSGNKLDRQSEARKDDAALTALQHPQARVFVVHSGKLYLKSAEGGVDPYFTPAQAAWLGVEPARAILLGFGPSGPLLAAAAAMAPDQLPEPLQALDYRTLNVQALLDPDALGALAQAGALVAWHQNHRFCGRCGTESEMRAGGYKRVCPACGAEHFPRTDPVAIMLALAPDRCLLGRSPHFPPGMYSALAGFIEPGETIENAVRREVFEEAGINLGRVVYHASQPWPFPYSLMIGCYGEAISEDIRADANELEDCRWFGRDEVLSMVDRSHPTGLAVPPRSAIASHLIRAWAEERI